LKNGFVPKQNHNIKLIVIAISYNQYSSRIKILHLKVGCNRLFYFSSACSSSTQLQIQKKTSRNHNAVNGHSFIYSSDWQQHETKQRKSRT